MTQESPMRARAPTDRCKRSATTVARITADLRTRLATCQIPPGTRLNEVALSRLLEISRTPLREALHRLTSESLLTFEPNRGFFSRPLDEDDLTDVYEARIVIEVAGFRLACARATDEEVAALAGFWNQAVGALADGPIAPLARADVEFHERLIALGRNAEFVRLLRGMNARTQFVRFVALEQGDARLQRMFNDHAALLRALAARDADAGEAVMTDHIRKREGEIAAMVRDGNLRFATPRIETRGSASFERAASI